MAHIVTSKCVKCPERGCVTICPVDSFREMPHAFVIDPEKCIDCGVCVAECPFDAIKQG